MYLTIVNYLVFSYLSAMLSDVKRLLKQLLLISLELSTSKFTEFPINPAPPQTETDKFCVTLNIRGANVSHSFYNTARKTFYRIYKNMNVWKLFQLAVVWQSNGIAFM